MAFPRPAGIVVALVIFLTSGRIFGTHAANAAQWKSRTIYQLLTDRFSLPPGQSQDSCGSSLGNYCGGTFSGIINRLDYIQKMGFDALWISPVVDNTDNGYHGYWARNLSSINSHFGSDSDLKKLVSECHNRGIFVMVDVVANHMGYGAPGQGFTLGSQYDYHDCSSCPSDCSIQNFNDQPQVEHCKLVGLPDVNQSNPSTRTMLKTWINSLVKEYGFDGIRIDTVPEVAKDFWGEFKQSSGVFSLGEIFNGNLNYVAGYQSSTPGSSSPGVDGPLSYPLYFTMRSVFSKNDVMASLGSMLSGMEKAFQDTSLLGTFADNHDNPRFLSTSGSDMQRYKNLLTMTLLNKGIPIIYYGTEQAMTGDVDPANRAPLWDSNSGYSESSELYEFIQRVVSTRKENKVWKYDQVQRYSGDNFYAFSRGQVFVCLTNAGEGTNIGPIQISYHPFTSGQRICNVFYPSTDCIVVGNGGFEVYLANGESKIYVPSN